MTNSNLFDLFWENSKLNSKTIIEFSKRIDEYSTSTLPAGSLLFPSKDIILHTPHDRLLKIMRKRKSTREFSEKPVNIKTLGNLFSSFMKSESGTRTFASAGSTYALEVFCICNNVKGEVNGKVVYYNADNHSLSVIKDAPSYTSYKQFLNLDTNGSIPPLVFIFTILANRTTDKYGERGARFALIELGHAVQNLALRLVQEKMAGVEAGGLFDDKIAELLGIDRYPIKVALGYLCGFAKK